VLSLSAFRRSHVSCWWRHKLDPRGLSDMDTKASRTRIDHAENDGTLCSVRGQGSFDQVRWEWLYGSISSHKSKISLQQCLGKFIVKKRMTMYSARPPDCIATFRLVINLMHSCGFVNYPTEHFTAPESLSDPVDCPSCRRKTPTKKQHTFAKLPKVLCLHLKRFDAATNNKIDDFVSFPASGLDMGRMLPHW
jgi:ubiquitin C-terminal hydrolase